MAKARKMELPTVDAADVQEMVSEQLVEQAEAVARPEPAATVAVVVEQRQISVPLANLPFGYLPRRIDLRKLTGRQSQALRQLEEALASKNVRLRDGSRINNPGNAIKWLLESLASL